MTTQMVHQQAPPLGGAAQSWTNKYGELVTLTPKGLHVAPVAANATRPIRSAAVPTRVTPAVRAKSLTDEVRAELKEHPGVVAYVDEERGRVAMYMKPVPYFTKS